MYILSQLFREFPAISERTSREDSEYRRLAERLEEEYAQFARELSDEGLAHFQAFGDVDLSMHAIEAEDSFIEGFRLGARIMLAVLGDYRGQFRCLGEKEA